MLKNSSELKSYKYFSKFYMGYKLDEIANILDVPVGTVKGKMYTALRNMKKDLEVR